MSRGNDSFLCMIIILCNMELSCLCTIAMLFADKEEFSKGHFLFKCFYHLLLLVKRSFKGKFPLFYDIINAHYFQHCSQSLWYF